VTWENTFVLDNLLDANGRRDHLFLLSVLLFTTHAVSLRVRGINGPNPEVELISVKESSEKLEKEETREGANEGDKDMEAWVEENI